MNNRNNNNMGGGNNINNNNNNNNNNDNNALGSHGQFKTWYFELVLWDAAVVRSPVGEVFLACLWVRYHLSIITNLGSY